MRFNLKQIRPGAAGLAVAFMLTGVSPSFVAFAQVTAPAAAALPEPAIKALQDALNRQGIAVKADGVLNEETRSAILRYQSQHHLPGTGDPDKATLDKLGVRLGTAPDQLATVAQAAPAEGPPAQAPSSPQAAAAPMPGGMMISGPMMQGMMQTMRAMMTMMEEHMQPGSMRSPQAQGGMMMNCPMMSGARQGGAPPMMQMMQGMMEMMMAMHGQMQSRQMHSGPGQPEQMQPGLMQGGPTHSGRH